MGYFVYILYSSKLDTFYIGQTNNLDNRLARHNSGYEVYSSSGVPWVLQWETKKSTRSEAVILERKLKNLSQARLRNFIDKYKYG